MANTGVLPFVRGIDFTRNDFSSINFPPSVQLMSGLQWMKVDRSKLSSVPEELRNLVKLEHLSLTRNNIEKLCGELAELQCLRSLNARRNLIQNSGISPDLFNLEELTTLDLSHNNLTEVPEGLDKARTLLVLNLSHNKITAIQNTLFMNLTDLLFLDVSNNLLETLPPQMRRLTNLQTLILNNNPLTHFQLRQLPSLVCLEVLHMRNTRRSLNNLPGNLDSLSNLADIDLSWNALPKVPDALYSVINLKRLNLSNNEITEMSSCVENWTKLEILNLCSNKIKALPVAICKLQLLRRLYLNDNDLDFEGIPSGIGKLANMEIFSAASNRLEMIPEGLCRCGALKKLILSNNQLITLPDTVHLLSELVLLDVKDNPEFVMPPKPGVDTSLSDLEFYNIDFSLQTQLQMAGAILPQPLLSSNPSKDPIARKLRLRRGRKDQEADSDQAKILKGMKDIAKEKDKQTSDEIKAESLKPKRWDETLEKLPLDYSEYFDDDDGQIPGLTVWEIENFVPNVIEEAAHGKFYEADCYIILKTYLDDSGALAWKIYFWIGSKAPTDKMAGSAIHAVYLRNHLGADSRTVREEQSDESEEFLSLFPAGITYIEGGRTTSGFYTIEEIIYTTKFYRVHGAGSSGLHLEPVAVTRESLDPRFVFMLDNGLKIFLWFGKISKNTFKSKTRLLAEKINKNERKNTVEILIEIQEHESIDFWNSLGEEVTSPNQQPLEHVEEDFVPTVPCLYQVMLGMGYLELPQVEVPYGKFVHNLLNSKNVYILDCFLEMFVWFGKKSTRLVRAAAVKLSQELFAMLNRPSHANITRLQEGTESAIFKTKFVDWDEVIAVDFTRTAESVQKTGADLTKWAKQQTTKTDLAALFSPRQPPMTMTEAQQLIEEWNEDLEGMDALVLEGKKFVILPKEEIGQFYSGDCYVFLCRYWVPVETSPDVQGEEADAEDEYKRVAYFWQGRDAGNMGWLTFTFSLQKKFQLLFGDELEVVRMHQQQENLKFLAHFKRKIVVRLGKRKVVQQSNEPESIEFYHLRANGGPLCTRLVQIKPDALSLNSAFCYILKVPFDSQDSSGIVYLWIGSLASSDDIKLAEEIVEEYFNNPWITLQVLNEGQEPENFFWVALGGKKSYDTNANFMNYTRLFRCSNSKGYFTVSEKCSDFCQDDLADDDIMILDNGEQIFLWLGAKCSEVEVKLAFKSAQVYIQHLRVKQPERPRKLFLTLKGKESRRFIKCFHGWGNHKIAPS